MGCASPPVELKRLEHIVCIFRRDVRRLGRVDFRGRITWHVRRERDEFARFIAKRMRMGETQEFGRIQNVESVRRSLDLAGILSQTARSKAGDQPGSFCGQVRSHHLCSSKPYIHKQAFRIKWWCTTDVIRITALVTCEHALPLEGARPLVPLSVSA